jgi:hypothetical protein
MALFGVRSQRVRPGDIDVPLLVGERSGRRALLLGLCTAYQYDPARPVLWTRASLTRRVELYEPAGFYA